jgi:[acyl-carrier-protein] S-malonyltransferase
MQLAGEARPGAMAAIVGLPTEEVERVCRDVRESGGGEVVAANLNSATQTVISGEVGAVEQGMAGANRRCPARCVSVAGAYQRYEDARAMSHGEADETLATSLHRMHYRITPEASGGLVARRDPQADSLRAQAGFALPFGARQSLSFLAWYEASTGKVLRGLLKNIDKEIASGNVEDPASLAETLYFLSARGVEVGS